MLSQVKEKCVVVAQEFQRAQGKWPWSVFKRASDKLV